MKVIIAGAGKVGCMLTKKLLAEGYEVTLIDNNQQVMEVCSECTGKLCFYGGLRAGKYTKGGSFDRCCGKG